LAPSRTSPCPATTSPPPTEASSENPRKVGVDVNAWNDGLAAAGVLGVIKALARARPS